MNVFVFLGPSLERARARSLLDAYYLPPVRMGDIYALMTHRPVAIGIIDGYFESTPAVWHKEILFAMAQGVHVFGGSSMGALRAAELHAFGMRGVGRIFESYRDGEFEDDDEVAVVHGPADIGFRSLSEAMVNIRYGLKRAEEDGVIEATARHVLERMAKSTFYPNRAWNTVLSQAVEAGIDEGQLAGLRRYLERTKPDLKCEDAEAVLGAMAAALREGLAPVQPSFQFESTVFWERLQRQHAPLHRGDADHPGHLVEHLCNHVRLTEREGAMREGLFSFLVRSEAKRLRLDVSDLKAAMQAFRRKRDLKSAAAMARWQETNEIDDAQAIELARLEALQSLLAQYYSKQVDEMIPLQLKREGRYGALVSEVQSKWEGLQMRGLSNPGLEDLGIDMPELLEWYQTRFGRLQTRIDKHVTEIGFTSNRQFLIELFAEYLTREGRVGTSRREITSP